LESIVCLTQDFIFIDKKEEPVEEVAGSWRRLVKEQQIMLEWVLGK
jgi:uncharacterized protein YfaA (DUF2138 family)